MHHTGYLVWINDEQYWHRTMRNAHARVRLGQRSGQDVVIRSLLGFAAPRRAA